MLEQTIQRQLENYKHLIRTRAYFLWVEAGKPYGRDLDFWLAAENSLREMVRTAFDKGRLTKAKSVI